MVLGFETLNSDFCCKLKLRELTVLESGVPSDKRAERSALHWRFATGVGAVGLESTSPCPVLIVFIIVIIILTVIIIITTTINIIIIITIIIIIIIIIICRSGLASVCLKDVQRLSIPS